MASNPAVSVIIPMYNAENFIGECLDSILAQTLKNYEIILVDDCSTDSSRSVAESYLQKFDDRLKIYSNEKNLGAGASRNNGLLKASGEYVFFMDSDDLLFITGLKKMYSLAKEYNVDVVNCTKVYRMSADGTETELNDINDKIDKVVIEEDIAQRAEVFLKNKFAPSVWLRLSRREFLLDNHISFLEDLEVGEDLVWTYGLFCAKKFLYLPQAYYFKRKYSSTWKERYYNQNLNVRYRTLVSGLTWIDEIFGNVEFFQQNPQLRHKVLDHFTRKVYKDIFKHSLKMQQAEIYESVKQDLGQNFGEHDVLIPALLTLVNTNQKKIDSLKKKINSK